MYENNAVIFQQFLETKSLAHSLQIDFPIARMSPSRQASLLKICFVRMYPTCSHSHLPITCRFMLQVFSGSDINTKLILTQFVVTEYDYDNTVNHLYNKDKGMIVYS